jgi:hypothetical protein
MDHLIALDDEWSLWRRFAVRSAGLPVETVGAFSVPGLVGAEVTKETVDRTREITERAVWSALADDRFTAALTWQNPSVVDTWAARLAERARTADPGPLTRRNERERVVARYSQRYATKNESIGFVGPVAWGTFTDDGKLLAWRGDLGLRSTTVHFEVWAVEELARSWAALPELEPHLPVWLHPAGTVSGSDLLLPLRRPQPLTEADAAVLAAVGRAATLGTATLGTATLGTATLGTATLGTVVDEAGIDPREAETALARLRRGGMVRTGFRIPFDEQPERHLRAQIERIDDDAIRGRLIGHLDDLESARARVAEVATEPVALRAALRDLAETLGKAGGTASRKIERSGLGRTAAYPDCRRDLDVEVAPDLLDPLRRPLGLLLRGADWLAAEVADVVERHLAEQYARLRRQGDTVTLADLQAAATEVLVPGNNLVAGIVPDFQLRWAELLPSIGAGPVRRDTAAARTMADALFPLRRHSWSAARRHAPDLLLARRSGGDFQWVLGELHVALNTMESRLFATQCEFRPDLIAATAADFPTGRVVPLYPPNGVASNSRTYPPPALDPPGVFHYWSYAADHGHEHGGHSVPATAVVVTERDGTLIGDAGDWSAPVLEFFGEFLTALCVNMFKLRAPSPHAPRVLLDDLVVCRESWSFDATEVPLPRSRPQDPTYQGLRDWARTRKMPRHVFAHLSTEVKPVYVDLTAPALLDDLARLLRAAAAAGQQVSISEMLPGPDELWLADADAGHYTTEFRMVAVRDRREIA